MTDSAPARLPAPRAAPSGRRLRAPIAFVALTSVAVGVVGYLRFLAPISVTTHRVERGAVVERAYGRGTVESEREAQLGFDLVGRISDVLVDEGARVVMGQELARLAPEQVEADLRTATSGVAAARTSLVRLAAEERRGRAALDAAMREERRAGELAARGALAQHEVDLAGDQARLARADLDRILAQRSEATRGIDVAAGGVEQRRVTVLRATLLAPFDGLVTRRLREPGDTVAIGTTVLRIVDTEQVHVSAWIDETLLSQLHEDQSAEIVLPGGRGIPGRVARIGWESDRQTHEIIVDVSPTAALGRIAIGQRADVWIDLARRDDVVRVPTSALAWDEGIPYCNVDRDGRIARARVVTGRVGENEIEIVDGLAPGALVLTALGASAELPEGRRWSAR